MSAQSNAPVIIKRVKKGGGESHHGGAWKVAYADFVTAMMAFFMLMWLLNATTEKQRKGLADYFSPTIPFTRASGGGDGAFGGDSVFTNETLAQTGYGGVPGAAEEGASAGSREAAEQASLKTLEDALTGTSGDSIASDLARRHIVTDLTDEGLVIQVFDLPGEPLFVDDSDVPTPVLEELVRMFARAFGIVRNGIAIGGHVAARPVVLANSRAWEVSGDRATRVRVMLRANGVPPDRLQRVTGHADRAPAVGNPMAVRNNRIELILLRSEL